MAIIISQIKLPIDQPHDEKAAVEKAISILRLSKSEIKLARLHKTSVDARHDEVMFVSSVYFELENSGKEHTLASKNTSVRLIPELISEKTPDIAFGDKPLDGDIIIAGFGPAGMFCALTLCEFGYKPIVLERGAAMDERISAVERCWRGGRLDPRSNVQFGEGGAGTFSDGKLNTLIHDTNGRHKEVLRLFVKFGAPENILYDSKPHIGTDILENVVTNIRNEIINLGGEVRFHAQVTDFDIGTQANGSRYLKAFKVTDPRAGESYLLETELAVIAIGHSARDTFDTLLNKGFDMCAKSFAIGVRIEHSQDFINKSQYGNDYSSKLPAAPYKLTARAKDGRGVYTFCMCPGGYVVNASSEEKRIAVNGMSYSKRNGANANSAVIVTVTPEDFPDDGILSGMEFQRKLEEEAYREGKGSIPVQLFKDYCDNKTSTGPGEIIPQIKGQYAWANVRKIFPENLANALEEGIFAFDHKIKGYARGDAVLSGVESRTSSPVRIIRDDDSLESNIRGVYPCGEGAGYAGGITSAAIDGLKVAETVITTYAPFDRE